MFVYIEDMPVYIVACIHKKVVGPTWGCKYMVLESYKTAMPN